MSNKRILVIAFILCLVTVCGATFVYYKYNINNYRIVVDDNSESKENNLGSLIKVTSYEDFTKYTMSDKNIFVVFGKTGCVHCERYYPILENVSNNYNVDIVYVDVKSLSKDDLNSVLNSPIIIPSKCNSQGEDIYLNKGFGTPLSLFINNNKTYECLRGYQNENDLIKFLRKIGYIG